MSKDFVVPADDCALVRPRVSPGSKNTGLEGTCGDGALELRTAAPSVGGRANAEAEHFVARLIDAASSEARVVRGLSVREKTVYVGGESVARGAIPPRVP